MQLVICSNFGNFWYQCHHFTPEFSSLRSIVWYVVIPFNIWNLSVYPTGGPGSGKGTQCSKIVEEFGYVHLSAGDLLRQEVARASERGQMIEDLMKEGKLVPQVILLFLHNGS